MATIQNIIFDLDGTLWDSRKEILEAWKEVIPNLNISYDELTQLMGSTNDHFLKTLFPTLSFQEACSSMKLCEQSEVDYLTKNGATLYPNVLETLASLHQNYHLFIVSNCQQGYVDSFLNHYHISHLFQDFESSGITQLPKDQNIKILMERNHILSKNTCYVGDTSKDLKAANLNHISFIWASYGFGDVSNHPYTIRSLEELKSLLPMIH